MNKAMRVLSAPLVLGAMLLVSGSAQAADVTLGLVRTSALTNVDDNEGRWQFDGGIVNIGGNEVGRYVRKKRVSFGASSLNRAATEITVIWNFGDHSFTLQGIHFFGDGSESGGVSATSPGFAALQNGTFSGNHTTITVSY